jgi:cytochrome P450
MPFGWGARRCVGETFAYLELVSAVAMILQDHRISAADTAEVTPVARLVLRPNRTINLLVTRRQP